MKNQTRRLGRDRQDKGIGRGGRLLPLVSLMITMILVASLTGGLSEGVYGQGGKFPAPTGYVNDFAGVISPETDRQLEQQLTNFEQQTGTQVGVVTLTSLEGRSIEEVANELYRAWGIGGKTGANKDKGALLVLAIQDRKTRLEVGYGLEGDLPDGLAGELIRRMRPFLQRKDYSKAAEIGVGSIVTTLSERWQIPIGAGGGSGEARRARPDREQGFSVVTLLVLGVVLLIIIGLVAQADGGVPGSRFGGKRRTGVSALLWLFPTVLELIFWLLKVLLLSGAASGGGRRDSGNDWGSGGWGGGGGGGWGGGGGGGDWGGFGGGSSGGGGASDSW